MKARHQGPRPQRRAARSGPFPRTEDNPEFHFRVYVRAKLRVHRSSGFIAAAIGVAKKRKHNGRKLYRGDRKLTQKCGLCLDGRFFRNKDASIFALSSGISVG